MHDRAPVPAGAAAALRRQRLRRADLRNRLVPAAAAGHRLVGRLARRAARHVHGRHVPRQPAAAALHLGRASIRCASTPSSSSASASSACCCCSACRSSAASTPRGPAPASSASCCAASSPAICLLPPTLLMGATLPAIARWVEDDAEGRVVARLLLRRQHRRRRGRLPARRLLPAARVRHGDRDLSSAVGAERRSSRRIALADRAGDAATSAVRRATRRRSSARPAPWAIYVAIALSGMTALAAEVLWTRMLSLLFGATVYTFSLILAVFLFGLGIGSSVGSAMARNVGAAAARARLVPAAARAARSPGRRTC